MTLAIIGAVQVPHSQEAEVRSCSWTLTWDVYVSISWLQMPVHVEYFFIWLLAICVPFFVDISSSP